MAVAVPITPVVPPVVVPPVIPPDPTPAQVTEVTEQTNENFEAVAATTNLSDIDTTLRNILFSFPNCKQGWKVFCLLSWSSGSLVQFMYTMNDLTPANPLLSQNSTR